MSSRGSGILDDALGNIKSRDEGPEEVPDDQNMGACAIISHNNHQNQQALAESASKWSNGFKFLLEDPEGIEIFQQYLKTETAPENLESLQFVFAARGFQISYYKKPENRQKLANAIIREFIVKGVAKKIGESTRKSLAQIYNKWSNKHNKDLSDLSIDMFTRAQEEIERKFEMTVYRGFLKSDYYIKCLNQSPEALAVLNNRSTKEGLDAALLEFLEKKKRRKKDYNPDFMPTWVQNEIQNQNPNQQNHYNHLLASVPEDPSIDMSVAYSKRNQVPQVMPSNYFNNNNHAIRPSSTLMNPPPPSYNSSRLGGSQQLYNTRRSGHPPNPYHVEPQTIHLNTAKPSEATSSSYSFPPVGLLSKEDEEIHYKNLQHKLREELEMREQLKNKARMAECNDGYSTRSNGISNMKYPINHHQTSQSLFPIEIKKPDPMADLHKTGAYMKTETKWSKVKENQHKLNHHQMHPQHMTDGSKDGSRRQLPDPRDERQKKEERQHHERLQMADFTSKLFSKLSIVKKEQELEEKLECETHPDPDLIIEKHVKQCIDQGAVATDPNSGTQSTNGVSDIPVSHHHHHPQQRIMQPPPVAVRKPVVLLNRSTGSGYSMVEELSRPSSPVLRMILSPGLHHNNNKC